MVLNYDILLNVMTFLVPHWGQWYEQRDLLALMRTCRSLYRAGMPIFLGGDIQVTSEPSRVYQFSEFVLGDPDRPHYLRDLSLEYLTFPRHTSAVVRHKITGRLAELLSQARNLKRLHITSVEDFLESDQRLATAIASLRALERIGFYGVGDRAFDMVTAINCAVTYSDVGFIGDVPVVGEQSTVRKRDPIPMLANFHETLTELKIHWSDPPGTSYAYPFVTALFIEGTSVDVAMLAHCFPNLTHLTLAASPYQYMEELDDARHKNQEASPASWETLYVLTCGILPSYALGLSFTKVRVWVGAVMDLLEDLPKFYTVLEDIRPSHLKLTVACGHLGLQFTDLDLFFSPPGVSHLDIRLDIYGTDAPMADLMVRLTAVVPHVLN